MKAIMIALLIIASNANASVFFQGYSHHFSVDGLNEDNKMLIIDNNDYIGGWFQNSYENSTFIVGRKLNLSNENFEIGVIGTVMYTPESYYIRNVCDSKLCAVPIPYIKAKYKYGAIGLMITPSVATFMIGFNF